MDNHNHDYHRPDTAENAHDEEQRQMEKNVSAWLEQCSTAVKFPTPGKRIDPRAQELIGWLDTLSKTQNPRTVYENFGAKMARELLSRNKEYQKRNQRLEISRDFLLRLTQELIEEDQRDIRAFQKIQPVKAGEGWRALKAAESLPERLLALQEQIKLAHAEIAKAVKAKDEAKAEEWEAKRRALIAQYAKEEKQGMLH